MFDRRTSGPAGHRRGRPSRLLWACSAAALILAACGDDDDGDDGGDDNVTETSPDTDAGNGGDDNGTEEDAGAPEYGGHLVYGVEADTANPWPHYRASMAPAGYMVVSSITDSLLTVDENGETAPQLATSAEPNDDYTEWTFEIREGIEFHDGTPLDAEAVKFNIEACKGAPLTGSSLAQVGEVTAEGQTVTLATADGIPAVVLPAYFTWGACGYMYSQQWLESLPDVPQRQEGNPYYDEELAATPADGDPAAPVGVGAFVFDSYQPGNGNSFVANRNEDYWRGANGITGEELPYLDSVEIVVAVDVDSRANALRSGQFHAIHTSNTDVIDDLMNDDDFHTEASELYGDTNYLMMNVAEGTNQFTGAELDANDDNADNPLTTLACRRALAHALDLERLSEERGAGISTPANGPFPPGAMGHLDDTGYPQYDPEAAQAEMDTCLQERGTDRIQFSFNTTNDPFNVETNQLVISMWQEVFGDQIQADITPIEQGQYIGLTLVGDFDMMAWRSHSGRDPDLQFLWWHSVGASPIGEQALNFGRFSDEAIDEQLAIIRTNPDEDARGEAAEELNRQFGEQVYNLWLSWAVWAVITPTSVNGLWANPLADGGDSIGLAFSARHDLVQAWCDGGACD